jgi:hypothetical protein
VNPAPQKLAKRLFNTVWTESIFLKAKSCAIAVREQQQQVCSSFNCLDNIYSIFSSQFVYESSVLCVHGLYINKLVNNLTTSLSLPQRKKRRMKLESDIRGRKDLGVSH